MIELDYATISAIFGVQPVPGVPVAGAYDIAVRLMAAEGPAMNAVKDAPSPVPGFATALDVTEAQRS